MTIQLNKFNFSETPKELLGLIFGKLSYQDLRCLTRVCKFFNTVLKNPYLDTVIWKGLIQRDFKITITKSLPSCKKSWKEYFLTLFKKSKHIESQSKKIDEDSRTFLTYLKDSEMSPSTTPPTFSNSAHIQKLPLEFTQLIANLGTTEETEEEKWIKESLEKLTP